MVDRYGNWTYEPNTSEWIISEGYIPKTSIENLVERIILCFDCVDNYGEYNPETGFGGYGNCYALECCMNYVEDNGGFAAFDYYSQEV